MNQSLNKIIENKHILKTLCSSKICMRKALIKTADKKLISMICEIIYNFLNGRIDINSDDFNKLLKYKKILRKLVQKSNLKSKKKLLVQHGGFLQYFQQC